MIEKVIKILLIDDDEDDFILTRELFAMIKVGRYVLDWASSYESGLSRAQLQEHDVCLVDFSLGRRSGVDLIREARESRLTTPMILLTGVGSHELDLAAMNAGATDYLIKNETSPSRLERTVRYAVQLNIERQRTEVELVAFGLKHAAAAEIGRKALVGGTLKHLFAEVALIVARTLRVEYSRLLELTPDRTGLILRGGVGWSPDYAVDETKVGAGRNSLAGFTLLDNQTVIVADLEQETRFRDPLLVEHRVRSSISVVIRGPNTPYGVLGAHSIALRKFSVDDVNFLSTVANVLAEAIGRRRAEDELRNSEARFRRVIESNVFGIFLSDPGGKISSANDAFLDMVGYDRDDLAAGRVDWSVMTPSEYAAADANAIAQLVSLGVCDTYEKEFRRKDGSRVSVLISVATFEGDGNGGVAFVLDISDRKRAEESLRRSETWLDAIFDASRDGIVVEENDLIVYANKALATLYGYGSLKEIIGRHTSDFRAPADDQRLLAFSRLREAGEQAPTLYEFKGLRRDASLFDAEVSVSSLQNEGKTFIVSSLRDITQRNQAENALRESDEKFHQLADNITDAFWIRSADMRKVHYVSPAFERIWGRSVKSLYTNPHLWTDFIVAEDRDRVEAAFAELTSDQQRLEVEYRIVRPNGETRWVRVRGFPVKDEADQLIRHTGIVTDITDRKLAEMKVARANQSLRESEERYRELVENAIDIIYTLDLNGNYTSVNKATEKILGFSAAESLSRNIAQSVAPEFREQANKLHRAQLAGTNIAAYETEVIAKDGHRVTLEVNTRIINEKGLAVGVQGIARDITERKRREVERAHLLLELEAEQKRLVDIFTNAPAFIVSFRGPTHIFELANSKYYDLVGPRELVGNSLRDVFPDLEGQGFFELLDQVYATGVPFVGVEMPVTLLNGAGLPGDVRHINFVYHPLRDVSGNVSGIICHGVDVTEQVRSRHLLEESEEHLRQSQKLESVGMLAGGIAHDFNNLLTVILGHSDLVLSQLNVADPLVRNIEEINKAAERAASLTHQLLAFSRKQVLQPKVLDLNAVVPVIVEMIQRLVGEDIELIIRPGVGLGRVKADPGQIEQVIINLVVNARDAMPKGGKITIQTSNVYLDEEESRKHTAMSPGWHVRLSITDTGQGMDDETARRMFEPFFTTKEQGKGTGLGLATVYGIVKQSGGGITVDSEVDIGTRFEIYLPTVHEEIVSAVIVDPRSQKTEAAETILLAEDDEMVRHLTRESLELYGYTVLEAGNGSEALLASREHEGTIHLLLTDVVMPHMSGKELADQLSLSRPDTRVLYMSGYTDHAIVHQGVLDGDVAFLEKPFTPNTLALKVASVLVQDRGPGKSKVRLRLA